MQREEYLRLRGVVVRIRVSFALAVSSKKLEKDKCILKCYQTLERDWSEIVPGMNRAFVRHKILIDAAERQPVMEGLQTLLHSWMAFVIQGKENH